MPNADMRESGSGISIIRDEGVIVYPPNPWSLNFVGAGVTVTPNLLDPLVFDITIPGGGGGGPAGIDHHQTDNFIATALQTVFALSATPVDPLDVELSINGIVQTYGTDFTVAGTTLTWLNTNFTLSAGDTVRIDYDL